MACTKSRPATMNPMACPSCSLADAAAARPVPAYDAFAADSMADTARRTCR